MKVLICFHKNTYKNGLFNKNLEGSILCAEEVLKWKKNLVFNNSLLIELRFIKIANFG